MSVLVKGMRMPGSCHECVICFGGCCYVCPPAEYGDCPDHGRPDWCPLREIPSHGRLVDGDVLMQRFEKEEMAADEHGRDFSFSFKSGGENCAEWWSVQRMLMDAPTVIEAVGGDAQ